MKNREKWMRILGEEYFSPTVYRDEPILRTAATMRNYMPQQYREMRRLAMQTGRRSLTPEEIFYRQARFMEDFEDDYDYGGEFVRYFPTYQSMSDMQLRGYFSWRTRTRRGELRQTSLSFVFIYLYEMLNGVGIDTTEDGYARFKAFCDAYGEIDTRIRRYAQLWLRDFVIYYGLDSSLLSDYFDLAAEQAAAVLADDANVSDDDLFRALCDSSSYNLEHSRFYREASDDVRAVVCRAYRAYAQYYAKNRKYGFFESVFGKPYTSPYTMFSSAIFFPREKHPDADVVVGPFTSFACRGGKWTLTKLWSSADSKRQIGALLRAVDSMMRADRGYAHALKCTGTPKYLQKIIADAIAQVRTEQAQRAARVVRFDMSKLQGIRDAAAVTRDKLIVDEAPDADLPQPPAQAPEPAPTQETPFGLDETEYAVLRALLHGGDVQSALRNTGRLLSVVADGINEKCWDVFADTVLVFDADAPIVLEEYAEELKGYIV